jgi:penicillin-binding protein 2
MNSKTIVMLITAGALALLLVVRLFILQVIRHDQYLARAEDNRVQTIDQIPARGLVYDRYGELIVENQPVFSVRITPAAFDTSRESEFQYIAGRLQMTPEEVRSKIRGVWPYNPVTLKENVDFTTVASLEEEKADHPGIDYKVSIHRIYSPRVTMPHLMGYLNEITENRISFYQTSEYQPHDYKIGENVGVNGIERFYEIELRGQKGYHTREVNAVGQVQRDLGTIRRPKDGYNLYLSIDLDLQHFIEQAMGPDKGSIVVLDVKSGELLAATSKPDFNLMSFVNGISVDEWRALNDNPDKPMFNRIVQSGYPPGSTFKMVTAIAALEEGLVTPNTYYSCRGVFFLGGNRFRCWYDKGHGAVNMEYAITQSCDVYFYNIAWKLGINKLAKYGRFFGFGELTGIDLPGEKPGVMPTTDYFDRRYGRDNWKAGTVVNLGIGQGEILVTPIQMANYTAMLANHGIYLRPHMVRYVEDEDGIRKVSYPVNQVPVSREYIDRMRYAMWTVVNSYAGTGKQAAVKGVQVAGKTGTAQNVHGNYHGWFIGFAPYQDPEIAVAVIMENGGEGSDVAAPMCARVMAYYFRDIRDRKPFDPYSLQEKKFQTLLAGRSQQTP